MRATLLAVVDPMASELRPITHPRITAAGVVLWGVGGLAAGLVIAGWRIVDVLAGGLVPLDRERAVAYLVVGFVALSGLGATALIRPHAGLPTRSIFMAKLGVLAYLPLVVILWWIHFVIDPAIGSPYGAAQPASVERIVLRMVGAGVLVASMLSLRPNARALASRSLLMRTGQIDRQTLRALASALIVPFLGDCAELVSIATTGRISDAMHTIGGFLILIGSSLFLLGLLGVCVDAIRLAPVVAAPPLSLEAITSIEERAS